MSADASYRSLLQKIASISDLVQPKNTEVMQSL